MPMKKHKPEQIVALLRQIEVEIANGKSTTSLPGISFSIRVFDKAGRDQFQR